MKPTGFTSELHQSLTNSTSEAKSESLPSDLTMVENKEEEPAPLITDKLQERLSDIA